MTSPTTKGGTEPRTVSLIRPPTGTVRFGRASRWTDTMTTARSGPKRTGSSTTPITSTLFEPAAKIQEGGSAFICASAALARPDSKTPNARQPNPEEHRPPEDSHSTPPRTSTTRLAMKKGKYATPEPRKTPRSSAHDRTAKGRAASACAERSEEHTSELQSLAYLVCRLLLEKKKIELE